MNMRLILSLVSSRLRNLIVEDELNDHIMEVAAKQIMIHHQRDVEEEEEGGGGGGEKKVLQAIKQWLITCIKEEIDITNSSLMIQSWLEDEVHIPKEKVLILSKGLFMYAPEIRKVLQIISKEKTNDFDSMLVPRLVDVDWQLEYPLTTTTGERTPYYLIRFLVSTNTQNFETIDMKCSPEQVKDLVHSIQDALNQTQRSIKFLQS